MSGRPVWLASVSRRSAGGRLLATSEWRGRFDRAYRLMRMHLRAVGDDSRERLFRMNVTLCLHRAVSDAELACFPAGWEKTLGALAGGPVEVLWSKGLAPSESCLPCHAPGHELLDPNRPDLWVPADCGRCPPCRARLAALAGGPPS